MIAVAGARRTPGRLKTGGVPPKPPATIFPFSVSLGVLGLRIVVQDVAASFSDALSRQPSYSKVDSELVHARIIQNSSQRSCDSWCVQESSTLTVKQAWCLRQWVIMVPRHADVRRRRSMFQHSFCRRLSQPASCSTRHARFESEIVVTKQKIRSPVEKTQGVPAKELNVQRKR